MFIRVDDRLVHGQIVTAWLSELNSKKIIVVDDKAASNVFLQKALKMAVPKGIELSILSTSDFILKSNEDDLNKSLVLCKDILTAELIINCSDNVDLNLGNIGFAQGREKIYTTIHLDELNKLSLDRIKDSGIRVFYQMVPTEALKLY